MVSLTLPPGFTNLDNRACQMWNSDSKTFFQTSKVDVSAGLNATNFSAGTNGIYLFKQIDGNYRLVGDVPISTEVTAATETEVIDLSSFITESWLPRRTAVAVLDENSVDSGTGIGLIVGTNAKTLSVLKSTAINTNQHILFDTTIYVESDLTTV